MSGRAIAEQFGVSYQTADRLLRELVDEGHLQRRPASGSYVAGRVAIRDGVQLIFDKRARRAGSFGARLLETLLPRLRRDGIDAMTTWSTANEPLRLKPSRIPAIWESPATAAALTRKLCGGLIINDRPPPGLGALLVDSIGVDDYLGGACAAEIIARRLRRGGTQVAVLAGPAGDARSSQRVAGFLSVLPDAQVTHAPNWFSDDAKPAALALIGSRPDACFACNDRLAEAVLDAARTDANDARPPSVLIGFDDAPIAEKLHLSTISIPWDDLAAAVSATLARRLAGDTSTACRLVLSPRPVRRLT